MNQTMTDEEPLFPETDVKFATFWPRLGALILDAIIIGLITIPVTFINLSTWKIPSLYILTTLLTLTYKPVMEYRYGATVGKMAAGLKVVGHNFEKITLNEELKRVGFYYMPSILIAFMTAKSYFTVDFSLISGFQDFQNFVASTNPAIPWVNGIVFIFGVADCISFFTNEQRRSLHDTYAGTYVIQKEW
jgi:uncharacterized RDD family membrane protein YckC